MVNVYDDIEDPERKVIARVNFNKNLDFWNGRIMGNGGIGLHKGLTKLKKTGKFVLIHGTDWQGGQDAGEIISESQALQEILKSGNIELLDKFPELRNLVDEFDTD